MLKGGERRDLGVRDEKEIPLTSGACRIGPLGLLRGGRALRSCICGMSLRPCRVFGRRILSSTIAAGALWSLSPYWRS